MLFFTNPFFPKALLLKEVHFFFSFSPSFSMASHLAFFLAFFSLRYSLLD